MALAPIRINLETAASLISRGIMNFQDIEGKPITLEKTIQSPDTTRMICSFGKVYKVNYDKESRGIPFFEFSLLG